MAFRRGWAETQLPSASILLGKAGAAFYLGVGRMQDQALSTTGLLPTSELSASHLTHTGCKPVRKSMSLPGTLGVGERISKQGKQNI